MAQPALALEPDDLRRTHILAAAERAFARHGFHGASMQIVAAEARMSAGNLYRYFSSKEALVSGLAERDQAALAEDFGRIDPSDDPLDALAALLRKHLVDMPIGCSRLALEIWAEAGRNPDVARICNAIKEDVWTRLLALVEAPSRHAGIEPDFTVRVLFTVTAGLFKRRATEPQFDGEREVALALGIYEALFAGAIRPRASLGQKALA
jgi:TetR/AcrR family transcriptional regulator, repressor for uid operon